MFEQIDHPLVGQRKGYLPRGATPYAPQQPCVCPLCAGERMAAVHDMHKSPINSVILYNGDWVEVLSAWVRPYLDDGAPTLLYVRSRTTGYATHVTESDLY